jgi:hypothetical protein
MSHKVRTHKWLNGLLQFTDHFFDSPQEAISFANGADAHSAKVYDENDQIIHEANLSSVAPSDTYA